MKQTTLNKLIAVLEEFRAVCPDANVNTMLTLLEVAKRKGVTGRDIEARLNTNHATASRLLRVWDRMQAKGKPGIGFIEATVDPVDYRNKVRVLSPQGEEFLNRVEAALEKS